MDLNVWKDILEPYVSLVIYTINKKAMDLFLNIIVLNAQIIYFI
jgi:hypothetical protein